MTLREVERFGLDASAGGERFGKLKNALERFLVYFENDKSCLN